MVRADERFSIVFVCGGNTCRSPMAQGILRKLLPGEMKPGFRVFSAGVCAFGGGKASSEAIEGAAEDGVNLRRHRARPADDGVLEGADLILTLSPTYKKMLALTRVPRFGLFALKEFGVAGEPPEDGTISDPVGGSKETYRRCYREIKKEIERILPLLSALWEEKRAS
ncbi:MAG: low molecular weight protein arginine phosphatase [Candidatus Latescibacteria bacterium]|nr:low molecular weight protein arginine phosphatase [Candidatus Latescibacterota bacterium]